MNKIEIISNNQVSQYARLFDETNPNWSKSPKQNKYFLEIVQNMVNDILRSRGQLFLNEVYDYLGFENSKEGDIVGWIWNDGAGYIIFNIDFINDHKQSILLDFNVDGVI